MVTSVEGIKVGVGREQPRISKGTFIIGTSIFYITILFMYCLCNKNNKQNQHVSIGGILYIYRKDKQKEQTVTLSVSNCCYLYICIWYLYSTLFFITFIFKYYDTV